MYWDIIFGAKKCVKNLSCDLFDYFLNGFKTSSGRMFIHSGYRKLQTEMNVQNFERNLDVVCVG